MLDSLLLEAPLLERAHVVRTEREPFATLTLVGKAAVPIALDSFRVVRLDDMNRIGSLWQLDRRRPAALVRPIL